MQSIDGRLVYSATDLVGFLECTHLANLERAVAEGHVTRPLRDDPVLDRVAQRGIEHEQRFLADLDASGDGLEIVSVDLDESLPWVDRLRDGATRTVEAMRSGADVVYQAVLLDGQRLGLADFLRRVETPSDLGAWSYEVWDTKLARHPKASAVLQLCMYSELVRQIQGLEPDWMHLALGGVARETVSFRVPEYAAYYRSVAREFETLLDGPASYPVSTTPEPVQHCDLCRWVVQCREEWLSTDDLSLVAGLTSRQRKALHRVGVNTRHDLATLERLPGEPVDGISRSALARIHDQARVQVESDRIRGIYHERIPLPRDRDGAVRPNQGLGMLPPPSEGDLFFDIEGDPFFGSEEVDGVDYLFGAIEPREVDEAGQPRFHAFWSVENGNVTPAAERRAFERFIDLVMDRLDRDPGLHVYHYAPYEPTAMKRLAGRYATRESEVDQLLRGGVFVDLYRAVRQGIRAGVESYSIKKLEPLYGFRRDIDLRAANESIVEFETWLELGASAGTVPERDALLDRIAEYNRDDCLSTLRLRDWLETQRDALAAEEGEEVSRPRPIGTEEREDSERQQEIRALAESLSPPDTALDPSTSGPSHGRWLLAQLLDWHRREDRSFWWRYFFLKNELTNEERREESDALGELTPLGQVGEHKRSWVYGFRFPPQEHRFEVGDQPHDPNTDEPFGQRVGTIHHIDDSGYLELRLGKGSAAPEPTALIPGDIIRATPKPEALERIARSIVEHGIDGDGPYRAARDLLMRASPRFTGWLGGPLSEAGEDPAGAARNLVMRLEASYLAIQGPPGSGKTTLGAGLICDLVEAGRRVGITANSHRVIGNLLEAVAEEARRRNISVRIGQRSGPDTPPAFDGATHLASNDIAFAAIHAGELDVVGGTSWLWAREDMEDTVDVLVVDEAGQMSLADVIASSAAAESLVLLGDPQQLDQPLQGVHPSGSERSALAHLLDEHSTMPGEYGLFLDGTWRLHPAITRFTSEVFYEGRLQSRPGLEQQQIDGAGGFNGSGLRFIAVAHEANSSEAVEEAEAIHDLLEELMGSAPTWTDATGEQQALTRDGVLLITPYNAQIRALEEALEPIGPYRIGTVDKFQGQQAPVSIYSMATSSAEDAPRGMEFLYSLNRLNVATSRARCLAVVVVSPGLLRVRCRTPRQIRLASALARLVELAE